LRLFIDQGSLVVLNRKDMHRPKTMLKQILI